MKKIYVTKRILLILIIVFYTICEISAQNISLTQYESQAEIKASGSITLRPGFNVPAGSTLRIFIDQSIPTAAFNSQISMDQNYVSTRIFKVPGVNIFNLESSRQASEVNQSVEYLDGLGRTMQNVQTQATPTFKDLVQPIVYDSLGREAIKYQAYASQSNVNGSYRPGAVAELNSFFNNPTTGIQNNAYPYSETVFEASPMSRVLTQGSPGTAWQVNTGHSVKATYSSNSGNEVRLWVVSGNTATANSFYQPGTLYKTIIRDENVTAIVKAGSKEEFKDLEGRVILKRVWESESKSLSTYYVYDQVGNLRYVLPPAINENGQSFLNSFGEGDAVFSQFIYGYHYDSRQRVSEKKIPGKGWEIMLYNTLNQLVLSQDAVQMNKSTKEYNFTKYDAFGRIVIQGIFVSSDPLSILQSRIDGASQFEAVNRGGLGTGYTSVAFPQTEGDNYLINYYDDYSFPGATNHSFSEGSHKTKTLLTGVKKRVLGTAAWLQSIIYYDDEARITKNFEEHYLGGKAVAENYDETTNLYNFAGELKESTRKHYASGILTTIFNRFEYDHQGRQLNSYEAINSQVEIKLSAYLYNEVGQLSEKQVHGGLQATKYLYNERGWLKGIASDQFNENLLFEGGSSPQWNGNISGQSWTTSDATTPNVFTYIYDPLNRLKSAISTGIEMSELVSYDEMGNIKQLKRDDEIAGTYNYSGNKLTSIIGGPLATGGYAYDSNGNTTTDGRNGVALSYSYLNLPQSVSKTGLSISYIYDATGKKLRKISSTGGTTDYIDGIHYKDGVLDFIQTSEGLARNSSGTYSYEYNITDHLGNVRYSFKQDADSRSVQRLQEVNYYAFGLKKVVAASQNKYLYNNKELQEELENYDYGARFYDPVIGRWNGPDVLSEIHFNLTPYNYVMNNPTYYIDPLGLDTIKLKSNQTIKRMDYVVTDNGSIVKSALEQVQVTVNRPIHDSTGKIIYDDGTVENFVYNDGDVGKYAVFTDRRTGAETVFPGVNIDPAMVTHGAGSTYPWHTIHMSTSGNGLADLQHEYGHILDLEKNGKLKYLFYTMPYSFASATISSVSKITKLYDYSHKYSPTEVIANKYASEYFGPKSAISGSLYYPKK